ncbi:hypothetical protein N781_01135 [Pontibacillus halophilus JSM 076056 = DSM 19796]|uniref:ATP synthase subunit B n=1 Tax=Pontibacillus halophilus JSM 076056 = DSM 19796 TaxID=1385510 RepID=A0A0A5IDB6_9BACI|nr:hypothetical protein [Pontibacillus halophilus]KGX93832.1 hypothetical protein N781_01135 [Pontibacillus halophilus JSM 076056 = DSM 19796]
MSDLLKRGFLIGLGAAVNGKERVEKMMDDMIAKGQVTPHQAKEMFEAWKAKGENAKGEWDQKQREQMRTWLSQLGFVHKEEVAELEKRIRHLEEKGRER